MELQCHDFKKMFSVPAKVKIGHSKNFWDYQEPQLIKWWRFSI